jgi:hypothetical protein
MALSLFRGRAVDKEFKETRDIAITIRVNRGVWFSFLTLAKANQLAAYKLIEMMMRDLLARHSVEIRDDSPYASRVDVELERRRNESIGQPVEAGNEQPSVEVVRS